MQQPPGSDNETAPLLRQQHGERAQPVVPTANKRLGYAAACISLLTAACTFTLIRLAAHTYGLPPSSILLLRGAVLCALGLPYILLFSDARDSFRLSRKTVMLLLVRGAFGGVVYWLLINSIALLSAGDSSAFKATYLVFTAAMSALFLREGLTRRELVAFALAVFGALIISRAAGVSAGSQTRGAAYGLASAALMSGSATALRGLGMSAHFMWPVVALGAFSAAAGCVAGGLDALLALTAAQTVGVRVMLLSGVIAFVGQTAFSVALRNCKAGPIAMIECVDVPVTYLFGVLFLHEVPSMSRVVGALFMVAAAVLVGSSTQ